MQRAAENYAKASLILGVITIVTIFSGIVFLPLIAGGCAMILACLSRGKRKTFSSLALSGLLTGMVGAIIYICIMAISLLLYTTNPDLRANINQSVEQITGMDFEDDVNLFEYYFQ